MTNRAVLYQQILQNLSRRVCDGDLQRLTDEKVSTEIYSSNFRRVRNTFPCPFCLLFSIFFVGHGKYTFFTINVFAFLTLQPFGSIFWSRKSNSLPAAFCSI